ncbi:MAG: hypothetical protein A2Y07_04385 [Planctomycetes bacterium GWF2_50_10]|nr:MAG: hypothetical protein A2Y07_04385 [Planctomycetes bacterium GWF2_50_10]
MKDYVVHTLFKLLTKIILLLSFSIHLSSGFCIDASASLKQMDIDGLRKVVNDLTATFGDKYTKRSEYERRIDRFGKELTNLISDISSNDPDFEKKLSQLKEDRLKLQKEVLLTNPLLINQPIIFVTRKQYRGDHHNTATFFPSYNNEHNDGFFEPGGALRKLDIVTGTVTTLLKTSGGVIRDPEVSFDGEKILFSMRRNKNDSYHIYEINADGTGLCQVTFSKCVDDIDPVYLPDDSIVFSSTREPKYCMCNKHIMCNLFKMGPNGEDIHQIGKSTLFEGHSSLLPDGRIIYDRWEYVDRNFGDAQGLWTVNPDGTDHAVYWGNNTNSPGAVLDPRAVPDSDMVVATFSSCHDRPWGAIALIDRRFGVDGKNCVIQTWPKAAINLVNVGDFDSFMAVSPKYEDPFPLNNRYFLCSRAVKGEEMGIFLVDVFGNETQIHVESPGCFDPMPLKARIRPGVKTTVRKYVLDKDLPSGKFYISNVYTGTHMKGVAPESVKYLRVVESPEKRTRTLTVWLGQGSEFPAMGWYDFNNKRILGTVPVEKDGSAYFEVPAEKFVYFQLLDENKQMIQSMRSGTIVQAGETKGCIGCHESRTDAPPVATSHQLPTALRRAPNKMNGWYGPTRTFGFLKEVQPVFTANCTSCHDFTTQGGAKADLKLSADKELTFNVAYNELWRKKYVGAIGAGPAEIQQAYSWGSHNSKLIAALKDDAHKDIHLTTEEFERIATWIDLNGPYYSEYTSAYPDNLAGRSPLNNVQLDKLGAITSCDFQKYAYCETNIGPLVIFDRPELSPCLAGLAGNSYQEALGIIHEGKKNLETNPRDDMESSIPSKDDQAREAWYQHRKEIEQQNRKALINSTKQLDK